MPRIIVTQPDQDPQPYKIPSDMKTIVIGRDPSCQIILEDLSSSGFHAEIRKVQGGYIVKDTDSTNGIKINGKKKPVIDLDRPRKFQIGDVAFEVSFSDEEKEEIAQHPFESREEDTSSETEKSFEPTPTGDIKTTALRESGSKKPQAIVNAGPATMPAHRTSQAAALPPQKENGFVGFLSMVVILVIGALAFLFGMSKKHEALGGSDFWGLLFNGQQTTQVETPEK